MAEVVETVSVSLPRWRFRMAAVAVYIIAPFIWSDAVAARVVEALASWIVRGARVDHE